MGRFRPSGSGRKRPITILSAKGLSEMFYLVVNTVNIIAKYTLYFFPGFWKQQEERYYELGRYRPTGFYKK